MYRHVVMTGKIKCMISILFPWIVQLSVFLVIFWSRLKNYINFTDVKSILLGDYGQNKENRWHIKGTERNLWLSHPFCWNLNIVLMQVLLTLYIFIWM